jgi:sister-chromatid-cohesion protein PDS5
LPSADELLAEIFRDLFTIAKRDFTRKVELYMADILIALIDECNSLPSDVMEVIMAQFIDKTVVGLFLLSSVLASLFWLANLLLIVISAK